MAKLVLLSRQKSLNDLEEVHSNEFCGPLQLFFLAYGGHAVMLKGITPAGNRL